MKHTNAFAAIGVMAMSGLLMSLRVSHAMSQGSTVAIAGNHPNLALTGWSHAAGDLELHMTAVLALRNQRELAELKTQLQRPGSPNYHKWLSTAEFMRRFGLTQQQMNDVKS
jgi:subtilase family serine protease